MLLNTRFWSVTVDRAIRTAAQTAVVLLGAGQVDVLTVDWTNVASLSAGAAILSVLTSLALPPGEAKP